MDPEKQRLEDSPRDGKTDAFFQDERSTTTATRTVKQIELDKNGKDTNVTTSVSFPVFTNKHVLTRLEEPNPLPHQRKTAEDGPIDTSVAGWTHNVNYECFFSSAARALSPRAGEQRLKVKLLFGTRALYYRHGVCGAVENSAEPTMLIFIGGVEPGYKFNFYNPANPSQVKPNLPANNRWGCGITEETIGKLVALRPGGRVDYDITVCAAFSTGHAGLSGSIEKRLFPLDRLERVVIYDCLFSTLKPALDRVKAIKGSAHIIVYVCSLGAANSFNGTPSFETLALGKIPGWNYVNIAHFPPYHAITSARIVSEARSPAARILDPLPAAYETALNAMVAKLPPRNSVISDEALFRKVRGNIIPPGAKSLAAFASDPSNRTAIGDFFNHYPTTRHCLGRAQLLGWWMPPGEEWHDMVLVEFAWEYLS